MATDNNLSNISIHIIWNTEWKGEWGISINWIIATCLLYIRRYSMWAKWVKIATKSKYVYLWSYSYTKIYHTHHLILIFSSVWMIRCVTYAHIASSLDVCMSWSTIPFADMFYTFFDTKFVRIILCSSKTFGNHNILFEEMGLGQSKRRPWTHWLSR